MFLTKKAHIAREFAAACCFAAALVPFSGCRTPADAPLPPDIPLAGLPMNGGSWTPEAVIVQLWGESQWEGIVNAEKRAPWLAAEFGFNAVTVLPPEAHNAITSGENHITEAQFVRAMDAYRRSGFRVILYSSIMHCGHAPIWQDGTLAREHPGWAQRGPKGETITIYGQDWLCPSTGALEYTLDYTAGLVKKYGPDAVIMDNNEFFETPGGMTCYCEGCQAGFKKYARERFGRGVFGLDASTLRIPDSPGPLYNLWIHWRNRVWADATEKFRAGLRAVSPDIVLFSNTQYLFPKNTLATDLQYGHEDVVLSESRELDLTGQVDKLLLGKALAADRPLWNYLGTFNEDDNELLQPPSVVGRCIHATYACGARPWVVYYGFSENPEANGESLSEMARVLKWHIGFGPRIRGFIPYAPVVSLVSHHSFNIRGSKLVPGHLRTLRGEGIAGRIAEEKTLADPAVLELCRVLLVEDAPCLADETIKGICEFVRGGGVLLASADAGRFDESGRERQSSSLWRKLGLNGIPGDKKSLGAAEARVIEFSSFDADAYGEMEAAKFDVEPAAGTLVIPYRDPSSGDYMVYVLGEGEAPAGITVRAPGGAPGNAVLCFSGTPPVLVPLAAPAK
ncbi:MAG: beta-galactosidase [Acidobacteriota bacterium]|nr:beta-galactosidase [Acidobacteriota bacterium]